MSRAARKIFRATARADVVVMNEVRAGKRIQPVEMDLWLKHQLVVTACAALVADAAARGLVPLATWRDVPDEEKLAAIAAVQAVLGRQPHGRGLVFEHVALEVAKATGLLVPVAATSEEGKKLLDEKGHPIRSEVTG